MDKLLLDGQWDIRWCDGQRGGMPHVLHEPGEDKSTYLKGLVRYIDEDNFNPSYWMKGKVPGEIHLDLIKEGVIPSPYSGSGIVESRWVEENYWFYRREFDVPDIFDSAINLLVLEGLDLAATIFLNGEEIGRHMNAFRPCTIEITGKLRSHKNILTIQIESGLYAVSEKISSDYYSATMTPDILLHKRNWLRKTQSQMSWDWAPRLMNVGVTGSVYILSGNPVLVKDTYVSTSISKELQGGNFKVKLEALKTGTDINYERKHEYLVTAEIAGKIFEKSFQAFPEDGIFELEGEILEPKLWWPINMGDQYLYDLKISFFVDGKELYSLEKRIGFRHVTVDQSPHPEEGNFFIFVINGVPTFMKGANMVPADIITAAISDERYDKLIDYALEANFNFLRVWGGGLYESDKFYDLCNEKGILVWQEFVAACAVIPAADTFLLNDITQEALYQIRRLSSHPSLIAWCGNNEIGWGCNGRDDLHCGEDDILYEKIFPELLQKEDPDKYYQPTSPYSMNHSDLNHDTTGDQHPWSVGFDDKDSRKYEKMVCRFPNEGGILGPTSLGNIKKCLLPGQGYASFSWQIHDNMEAFATAYASPDMDLKFWTGLDISGLELEDYVYIGGFVQGEGFKRYIENFRRRKFSSSGAVFWMYNDCWPAVRSWTIVDHSLHRTPAFFHVKRSFSPITPVIYIEDSLAKINIVNDLLDTKSGCLKWGIFTVSGEYLYQESLNYVASANSSAEVASHDLATIGFPKNKKGEAVFVFACIFDEDGSLLARTRYSSLRYNELDLEKSEVDVTEIEGGLRFKSDVFTMGVCIDLEGDKDISDNFFDLYPGKAYDVICPFKPNSVKIKSVNDMNL